MQPVYQLDPTRLLPGDVILEAGEGWYARVTQFLDRGPFSHVILYLGANFIVEAVEEGVRIIQALRVVTFDPQTARALWSQFAAGAGEFLLRHFQKREP